ncbi:MAG: GntR family transcriptional regulator [bacterium]
MLHSGVNPEGTKQKRSLADQAYQRIEEMIVTLQLPPGSHFSEGELSERLGIGRTPIREALQRLAAAGLIAALPRRGIFVTEINIGEHVALLETRRVLDRLIASRAARRARTDQRLDLRRCAAEISEAAARSNLTEFMRLDRRCDQILEAACHNRSAVRACAPLHTHCRRFWYQYQENGDLAQSAALHAQVMCAVADGDENKAAGASDQLLDYLDKFIRVALEY